jgi:hypothetical protein
MAATLLVALCSGFFQAATTVVDQRGHLLTIEVVSNPSNPSVQGLRLVDRAPTGETTTETLLFTYDAVLDTGPNIAIDPADGEPVVVWSRHDGTDLELAMARRMPNSGGWGPLDQLTTNTTTDIEPRFIVAPDGAVHIIWWPQGLGGDVLLQSFDIFTGQPRGTPQKPLEPPPGSSSRLIQNSSGGYNESSPGDDPGVPRGSSKASANACLANPAAAPDHGALMSCGRPAGWQISSCRLLVGTLDAETQTWRQVYADLSKVSLAATSVRDIAQAIADSRCDQ